MEFRNTMYKWFIVFLNSMLVIGFCEVLEKKYVQKQLIYLP